MSGPGARWHIPVHGTVQATMEDLLACLRPIGEGELMDRPYFNSAIGYAWRGPGEADGWFNAYVLTPWMLARVFIPRRSPGVDLPVQWEARARKGEPYRLIGPALEVPVGEELHRLHLQWVPGFGHLFLQPLVQNLNRYADEAAVWAAWDGVLDAREQSRQERLARLQQPDPAASRREFLRRMLGAG